MIRSFCSLLRVRTAGRFPVAPGTAGTVVAVPLYLLLSVLSPVWYYPRLYPDNRYCHLDIK